MIQEMSKKGFEPLTLRLSGVYSYQLSYLPSFIGRITRKQRLTMHTRTPSV